MALTGKPLFDRLASVGKSMIDAPFDHNGHIYTLKWIEAVTGPYSNVCEIGGIIGRHVILDKPVDALVFRYSVAEGLGKCAVHPVIDLRVLVSAELPDDATDDRLVAFIRQLLEDAR